MHEPEDIRASFDEFDERINPRPEETGFDSMLDAAIGRRGLLGGVLSFGGFAAIGGGLVLSAAEAGSDPFGFEEVTANTEDVITLPRGYVAEVVVRWGDPILPAAPDFDPATRGTAESQGRAFGDNNDGMELFLHGGRTLLVANNEYANRAVIWGGGTPDADAIRKAMRAHGVSILEIVQRGGGWHVVRESPYNRRITPETPMALSGPAAGHALLRTLADPTGTRSLGTWNNCGNGSTPWGTYLACEENFNGYFSSSDQMQEIPSAFRRYGISAEEWGYRWAEIDERFDIAKHPNEPNRAGYVVEIDPRDPASVPRKRTALGRFKHENAEVVVNGDGRIVVYMGDDERGEFIYRFVSDGVYTPGGDGVGLLDEGTLSVARFHEDGTGAWLALTEETTGMSAAEICIHTRQAGSRVGATTMDRPEWVAANPNAAEIYCALTNNRYRGIRPNAGGDETPVGGPNPREANGFGQIVRWRPDGGDHAAEGFAWDLYVLAGNPAVLDGAGAGSANVTKDNMFNAPDGLGFGPGGLLWIQTDGNFTDSGDYAGQGNNQMLAGDPVSGEIRRFLVGPRGCEVTGLTWSPDRRTMFVGIQHPGAGGTGNWPEGGSAVPRSAIVAVRREDGGRLG